MDLDEFKTTWQTYDQKLDSVQRLGQQLLNRVLRDRSRSTIDNMIRELRVAYVILTAIILFFGAVIAGNAFDYTRLIHFVPAVGYLVIAAVGLYLSVRHDRNLRRTTLGMHNLREALTELIRLRSQHVTLMGRVWIMGMLAGSMIMLPNIVRKFPDDGWAGTFLTVLLPLIVTAVSVGLAHLAGLFTDRHLTNLREQAKELDELT